MTKPIFINDTVRVRLTDHGRNIFRRQIEAINLKSPRARLATAKQEDADGWSRWQLWDLMETFGQFVGLGRESPFTEIQAVA